MVNWLDIEALCDSIEQERVRQGLSFAELSRRSGVTASTISNLRNDNAIPKTTTLLKLVRALKMSETVFGVDL